MASQNLSSKSSFGQTLQFITDIKLQELEKQRVLYQLHANIVNEANTVGAQGDVLKKVEILIEAVKSWTGSGAVRYPMTVGGELNLCDLEFWLQHARRDPSFSRDIAEGWADILEQHILHTTTRFDAAKLFGSLFNEWLASGDSVSIAYQEAEGDNGFEQIGRKEMHEQKEKLQSIIYEEPTIESDALSAYLEDLFSSEESASALDVLRSSLRIFGLSLQRKTVTSEDVVNAIKGLLASDGLMNQEKRATLKAFQQNDTILEEVASVLTMRMANMDSWEWPKRGVLIEFRRNLNGKYRAFTDPDIVDALLLHHVGASWQVRLKASLSKLFESKAWNRPSSPTHDVQSKRYEQLGDDGSYSINQKRGDLQRTLFFVAQLQEKMSVRKSYGDDDDVDGSKDTLNAMAVRQKLLQIMTTECYLNTAVHGSHAVICSDFEWFGPSLPHKSILTVLEFLGMSKEWLRFYSNFLAMPVQFPGDAEPRMRRRGTAIDYTLSAVCGEAICFIMDYAVNQRADGLYLYRMHDDLWLWDSNVEKVASGWTEMQRYAGIVGLKFNETKTGSAYIGPANAASSVLPVGDIRWGFLKFDVESKCFRVDQEQVNCHISEMRRQLTGTQSVFGWVNVYNKYMAFFFRNFGGPPAKCFGKKHISELLDTFARIQRELFPATSGNGSDGPVGYLRRVLEQKFGVTDLPEGYFYFPIGSGGLELRHVMLELLAFQRDGSPFTQLDDPESYYLGDQTSTDSDEFDADCIPPAPPPAYEPQYFHEDMFIADMKFSKRILHDTKDYTRAKEYWTTKVNSRRGAPLWLKQASIEEFMSFEEYTSLRETWLEDWGQSYEDMLAKAAYVEITKLPKLAAAFEDGSVTWSTMNWYEKWVISMYGAGVIKKYGGAKAVDPALIPVGMVELFRTSKIKLDQ